MTQGLIDNAISIAYMAYNSHHELRVLENLCAKLIYIYSESNETNQLANEKAAEISDLLKDIHASENHKTN
ncbi:MAG: hypothetical protein V4494_04145 [Chlamydiota bacterium]